MAAVEVIAEAILEYALEKLLRDARASLIADGENNILSLKGTDWISKWYKYTHL